MRTARTGLVMLAALAVGACSDGHQTAVESFDRGEVPTVSELDNAYLIPPPPGAEYGPQRSVLGGGSEHTVSGRDLLEGSGKILAEEDFERFGPARFNHRDTPFVTGGLSYETGNNVIIGPYASYGLPSNFICNNMWTPMKGSVLRAEESVALLGFDVSVIGRDDPVDIEIYTTGGTYTFSDQAAPGAPESQFFGFRAPAGEQVTGFRLTTDAGGSGPCMDEVVIGSVGITVTLDAPDVVNLQAPGVYPVAVLSDDAFDATTLEPSSVSFGPDGAEEVHGMGHVEDVDEDGDPDMMFHFDIQDTGVACGASEAALTGQTVDGLNARGIAEFETEGCRYDGEAEAQGETHDTSSSDPNDGLRGG